MNEAMIREIPMPLALAAGQKVCLLMGGVLLAAALAWCGKNHIFKAGGHALDKKTYQVWRAVILFLILLTGSLLVWQLKASAAEPTSHDPPRVLAGFRFYGQGETRTVDDITYYVGGLQGEVSVSDTDLDPASIQVLAQPLDDLAREQKGKRNSFLSEGQLPVDSVHPEILAGTSCRITFSFNLPGKWRFILFCRDKEGNDCVNGYGSQRIASGRVVIDEGPPVLTLGWPEGVDPAGDSLYFGKNNRIRITLTDPNLDPASVAVEVRQVEEDGKEAPAEPAAYEMDFQVEKGQWTGELCWKKEGCYVLVLAGEDLAGQSIRLAPGQEGGIISDGVFRSKTCIADWTRPEISMTLWNREGQDCSSQRYWKEEPEVHLRVKENNFSGRLSIFSDTVRKADHEGQAAAEPLAWKKTGYEGEASIYETSFPLTEEAQHQLAFSVTDLAGNRTDAKPLELVYDTSPPRVSWQVEGCRDYGWMTSWRYFSHERVTVRLLIQENVSGLKEACCLTDQEKDNSNKKKPEIHQTGPGSYQAEFILDQDFKGTLRFMAEDACGNRTETVKTPGIILETGARHRDCSRMEVYPPREAYLDQEKKISYYKADFSLKANYKDSWSGLKEVRLFAFLDQTGGKTYGRRASYKSYDRLAAACQILKETHQDFTEGKKKGRKTTAQLSLDLNREDFRKAGPEGYLMVGAALTDLAGNESLLVREDLKLAMDAAAPAASVSYDRYDARNKSYYNHPRTARVVVRDRTFDPEKTKWAIKGSNRDYVIGDWEQDGITWTCPVYFAADGENYAVAFQVKDQLGHTLSWDEDSPFTVDRTPPETDLVLDKEGLPGGKYYREDKTIFFRVKERNPDPDQTKGQVLFSPEKGADRELEPDGKKIIKEDLQTAIWTCRKEGTYKAKLWCMDLAGNVSEKKQTLEFIIDKTRPRIRLAGIKPGETYGEELDGEVSVEDAHLDQAATIVRLERADQPDRSEEVSPARVSRDQKGTRLRTHWSLTDSGSLQEGVYRLTAEATDLAGNKSALPGAAGLAPGEDFLIRVNQSGARYTYRGETKKYMNRYLKKEKALDLLVRSVNPMRQRIYIIKDKESREEVSSGSFRLIEYLRETEQKFRFWYDDRITIPGRYFAGEGSYRLLVRTAACGTGDQAGRVLRQTDNEIGGAPIRFVIDKTAPYVIFRDLENKEYEEENHAYSLEVMDNYAFSRLELTVEYGQWKRHKETRVILPGDLDENGTISLTLEGRPGYQTISYRVEDQAGNVADSETRGDTVRCQVYVAPKVVKGSAAIQKKMSMATGRTSGIVAALCSLVLLIAAAVKSRF